MSFPLTYWNGLGLLAAAGIVLCVGLAASGRAHRVTRALAAAAVPMLAVGLYLTLSRGAILVLALGLVVFAVLARSRRLLTTVLAVAPPTALAVVVAYGRRGLTSDHPAGRLGVNGGRYLLLVLIACMLSAALLHLGLRGGEQRLLRWRPRRPAGRRSLLLGAAGAAVVVVVVALAAGAPHAARHLVTRFADSSSVPTGRSRLTDVRNAGRIEHWRVALHTFADHPLDGTGAGTYATQWAQHRRTTLSVQHAHSAYFGVLSDLGLPGGILLVGSVLALLVGLARRARGPDAALAAAAFAAALMWALHAGIDWDLEMPATGAWVFILGGGALARAAAAVGERRRGPGGTVRLAAGVAVLVVAVTPALIAVSQARIGASVQAFEHGDCRAAITDAISADNAIGLRPEPYEILGFCDAQLGSGSLAVTMMQRAVDRDPDWWEYRYGLALVKGAAGQDPRPANEVARRLNPRNELVRDFGTALRHATRPAQWRKAALAAELPDT
jgi:O-antigen ligase